MLQVIICEDNEKQRHEIETIIKEEIKSMNLDIKIALSTDNYEQVVSFVQSAGSNTFIYFFDVDINDKINGIELAKIIRKYDPKGYIIFVTSHSEMTLLTFKYKVQAMDYISKTDPEDMKIRVLDCIKEAITDYKNTEIQETDTIQINFGNRIVNYNFEDILFFETTDKSHKIRVHTIEEQLEFYGTMKEVELLVTEDFYKSHRSYLVNTKNIKTIDKNKMTIYMVNGEVCYISFRFLKGLLKKCVI